MGSQVAVAEVAVVPTFKGFRRQVTSETDSSAKSASQGFSRVFAKTGTTSGKEVGTGFKKAFEQSSKGTSEKLTKALEADIAKASRTLSAARLKEQDAAGKARIAERQLAEARQKYASDSSQVVRAEERMATASRQLEQAHERTEDATQDLQRAQGELARAADRAGDELAEAGERGVTGFRSNVVGGVKGFAGPLIAAFAALGIGNIVADAFSQAKDFVLGTIDIASDLNESVNAVEVSFGDASAEVLKLGENSAQAFGLSKRDLNAYATQFSSFVKTIAGSGGDVAGTLAELIGRGTDFASVMNLDVADALQVFQSGLAGETEPLRKYGIDLSAATVEQYAYANGIAAAGTQLTEAQKIQARYGSLLQQTNQVAGDFANTQDELANKNRINAAEWDNVQAKIGDAFLPVAKEVATIVGDDIIPVIAQLAEEQGPELAKAFADILPDVTALAKDALPLLPPLIEALVASIPPLLGFLAAMGPLFVTANQDYATFWTTLSGFMSFLSGTTSPAEFIGKLLQMEGPLASVNRWAIETGNWFERTFNDIARIVGTKINEAVGFLSGLPGRAVAALGNLGSTLFGSGRALMDGFLKGIQSMLDDIGRTVSGALEWVRGFFPSSPAKRGPFSGSGWTGLRKSGEAFWDQWLGGMGGDEPPFPAVPGFPGGAASFTPSVGGSGVAGARSVTQNITLQTQDPRLAVRQMGREAERAFAAS